MKKGTIAVFLVALLVVTIRAFDPPTNPLDEFLPLVCAQRVLAGEVPYRDFTTLYPPLTTLIDAGLLALFPPSVFGARLVFVALAAAGCALVKLIGARASGSERAGILAGLLAALGHEIHWGYSLVLATVLLLGSVFAALHEGRRAAIVSGLLLGLASLARHDAAFYAAVPIGLVVLSRSRRDLAWLLGVAACFPALLLVFLIAEGALGHAFEQLVVIPSRLYPRIRGLPFPRPWVEPADAALSPALGSIYGPFLVSGLALARAIRARRRDQLAVALLPFALGLTAVVRPDHAHVYGATVASFAALALLVGGEWKSLALALALMVPGVGVSLIETARVARHVFAKHAIFSHRPPRTFLLSPGGGIDNHRARCIDRVATRPLGSRIFVALRRHDRIWINDVAFYFDANALPATRHHELYALVATTPEVQEEIVRDLEKWKPPFVVVWSVREIWEPNASGERFAVHVLDDYIAAHYEMDLDEGRYSVLKRRE